MQYDSFSGPLTQWEAETVFRLSPPPPFKSDLSDWIIEAQNGSQEAFPAFLHAYEQQLNSMIHRFLRSEGDFRYDPERFLDIKLALAETLCEKSLLYDPSRGASFTTYVHPYLHDALLRFRMSEEAWTIDTLSAYKNIRRAAWIAAHRTIEKKDETPAFRRALSASERIRNRVPIYTDAEGEDWIEAVRSAADGASDISAVLAAEERYRFLRRAFSRLSYREQTLLEKRQAINMDLGQVYPMKNRVTYAELAQLFEGSSPGGAERAYKKARTHLAALLEEEEHSRS